MCLDVCIPIGFHVQLCHRPQDTRCYYVSLSEVGSYNRGIRVDFIINKLKYDVRFILFATPLQAVNFLGFFCFQADFDGKKTCHFFMVTVASGIWNKIEKETHLSLINVIA